MNREQIREIFLRNGFTIKEGQTDLKPYVYEAAEDLLKAFVSQQPAQTAAEQPEAQEPVAWEVSSYGGRVDRVVVREDVAQELASNLIELDAQDVRIRPLYAEPPAAEQPDAVPVPQVAG